MTEASAAPWPSRKTRLAIAFLLGAAGALIFAPFHAFPVGFVSFTGLIWLIDRCTSRWQVFWTGWFFGWGHFIAGLFWIGSAFLVDADRFAWMLPAPVLGLPAFLALFPAIAVTLAWLIGRKGPGRIVALAAAWTLLEAARGTVLTGFPWNLTGYAFGIHHSTMQAASWFGIHGLSFLAVLIFAAPSLLLSGNRRPLWFVGLFAAPLIIIVAAMPRAFSDPANDSDSFTVRIVQGNIQQRDKWRGEYRGRNFRHLYDLSLRGETVPDLIVWPETSATFFLSRSPGVVEALAELAAKTQSGLLITGAPRTDGTRTFNSAMVVAASGQIAGSADKHHLVPFGEYLPLHSVLSAIGLSKLTQGGTGFSAGPEGQNLVLEGLPDAAILICYEVIFPGLSSREPRPGWILNLTNDAWFGTLTGPYQHFDMARFRALEQGLPLVRAAGTGISGLVSRTGRTERLINLGKTGVTDVRVVPDGSPTLFSRVGSGPVLAACSLLLVVVSLFTRRRSPPNTFE